MTISSRLLALSEMARGNPDLEALKADLLHVVLLVELEIEKKRPGYLMDLRLGLTTKPTDDRPVNLEAP